MSVWGNGKMNKGQKKVVTGVALAAVLASGLGGVFVADASNKATKTSIVKTAVAVDPAKLASAQAKADASLNSVEKRQVTDLELKIWKAKRQNLEYLGFRVLAPAVTRNAYIDRLERVLKGARKASNAALVDATLKDLGVLRVNNQKLWDDSTENVKSIKAIKDFASIDADLVRWAELKDVSDGLIKEYNRIDDIVDEIAY